MTCSRCGAALEAGEEHGCASQRPDERTVVRNVAPGDVLDARWRIESRIGQGAMGSVFQGRDLVKPGKVAIKILSPEHCRKPKILARFEREARLMTSLRHPNIVKLHGVGRRGALPYIVMQYLEGATLSEHLRQTGGKLAPAEVLFTVREVCSGLSFIHHHGLVHRDIKPQNIFVGADGQVTILDLGVVRDRNEPGLTKPGAMVGTPYYMAPEQILGTEELDRRADIYSLGAVIFELLTGSPPFVAPSNFEVLHAHRNLAPPDASLLSAFVPKPVAEVINRALAKQPEQRQQSVHELLADLQAAYSLDGERTLPGIAFTLEQGSQEPLEAPEAELLDPEEVELIASGTQEPEVVPTQPPGPEATIHEQGELRVITTFEGLAVSAAVTVDQEKKGCAPLWTELPVGVHAVKVERRGCQPLERQVEVKANQVTLLRLELRKKGG